MTELPNLGDRVKIWPMPGRTAHANERPIDQMGGGRQIGPSGEEVIWSEWHLTQLRAGDVLLHDPTPAHAEKE